MHQLQGAAAPVRYTGMESPVTDAHLDLRERGPHVARPPIVVAPGAVPPPVSRSVEPVVDADRADDPYAMATAELYELLATGHWEHTGAALRELLRDVDPTAGPIVDLGAGTGIGLPYLLAAVPDAEIHAIEPSRAMRTALHTRLLLDPSLQGRVTVDPRPLAAALPERASAVVLSAVLGHLDDAERTTLWRFAAERMPAGAPTVIELLPPYRPTVIERVRYAVRQVGRFTYEGWQAGAPAGERTMRWTMTYRVLDGDVLVSERSVVSTYRCWSLDDLAVEVAPHGLIATEHPIADAVVLHTRPSPFE